MTDERVRDVVRQVVQAVLGPDAGAAPLHPSGGSRAADASVGTSAAGTGRMTIALGADHGGFALKQVLVKELTEKGYGVTDCGTSSTEAVDYPDFAHVVARLVASGACSAGIVVDGAGIGSCMTANKVPGVRAALCHDVSSARNSREHNHANVLTLGGRFIGEGLALEIVTTWLGTPWGPGRHAARVEKITEVERQYLRDRRGDEAR